MNRYEDSSRPESAFSDAMDPPFNIDRFDKLLCTIWRDASLSEIDAEHISHQRQADHWRIRRGDESFVLRVTDRPANAQRVVTALEALEAETFAATTVRLAASS